MSRYVTPLREGGSLPGIVQADDPGFIPRLSGSLLLGSPADRPPPRALITGGYALTCAAALDPRRLHRDRRSR